MIKDISKEYISKGLLDGSIKEITFVCDGRYLISTDGKVFTFRGDGYKQLENTQNTRGVWTVPLKDGVGFKTFEIAELVLETFKGRPGSEYKACHNDMDLDNVALNNLFWQKGEEYKAHNIKSHSLTIKSLEEKRRLDRLDVVKIKTSPYQNIKYEVSDEMFDMMVRATTPFYEALKGKEVEQLGDSNEVLLFSSGEVCHIDMDDIVRLIQFFDALKKTGEQVTEVEKLNV